LHDKKGDFKMNLIILIFVVLDLTLITPSLFGFDNLRSFQNRLRSSPPSTQQSGSVYPKIITPNGDGINDVAFFIFPNKTGAQTKGAIYDLRSAKVVDLQESNITVIDNTVMTWDGRDESGAVVPSGVYIYKIEIGDQVFSGTVGVAK
jgi:gliding motility-associated-like protein